MKTVLMAGSSVLTMTLQDAMILTLTGLAAMMVIVSPRVHHVIIMEQKHVLLGTASVEVEALALKTMNCGLVVMVIVNTRTRHAKKMAQKHAPLDIASVLLINA